MKSLALSKPVQAALWMTAALVALALLKPDAVEVAEQAPRRALQAARTDTGFASGAPWIRSSSAAWEPAVAAAAPVPAAPPAALPIALPIALAPTPPKAVAPDPGLSYLGRIEQDGRSYVFLGSGPIPKVVEIGGLVDPQWRVEKATASQVELRYLPLNETRFIAAR